MPWKELPINEPLFSGADEYGLNRNSPMRHNVIRDWTGASKRRPGLVEFSRPDKAGVDGLYMYGGKLLYVSNSRLYTVDEDGNSTKQGDNLFNSGTRVIWAELSDAVYAANGGGIVRWDGTTASTLSDPQIPTSVTHVAGIDTYLLANEVGTGRFHRSQVNDPDDWPGAWATTERDPDPIKAMHTGWGEVALWGTDTVEHWYDNGAAPFIRLEGTEIEYGTHAPYSIHKLNDTWLYLNNERRFVRIQQRSPKVLSAPVDSVIQGLGTISDAIADHVFVNGLTLYVVTFPTEGRTFIYDYAKDEWTSEWSYWDTRTASFQRWRGNVVCYAPDWNKHLVGDWVNGRVYYMDSDTYQDNGDTMRSVWRTPHLDHGTGEYKRSMRLRLRLRRGHGNSANDSPVLMLRYRDNGSNIWKNERHIDLGKTGETEIYKQIRRLGRYRSRQYEISVTDDVPLSLVSAQELVG